MVVVTTKDESVKAPAKRSGPERTCAGCGKHAPADDLVRVVHDPGSGELAIDLAASGFGRGAHVHGSTDCLAKALKGGFARVFKAAVKADSAALAAAIVEAADRRIEGLLTGARRAGQLAVGSDVVVEALERSERSERREHQLEAGRAHLVVVARDAAAATKLPAVERAIASGKAIALFDKERLGRSMARDQVAVVAILHSGVASAVQQTYRLSAPFRVLATGSAIGADSRNGEEAWSSSEVR